jgi:hypothetical protein
MNGVCVFLLGTMICGLAFSSVSVNAQTRPDSSNASRAQALAAIDKADINELRALMKKSRKRDCRTSRISRPSAG